MSDTSWMVSDYPDPPPGWADEDWPTPDEIEDRFGDLADRLYDEEHDH